MPYGPPPEHEAKCRRCGRCCYEKLIIDGHVFTTRTPCRYLDVTARTCTVYERRLDLNPRCLTVPQGIELGVFPADCPYVQGLHDYLPAEEGWLEAETVRKIERGQLRTYGEVLADMRRCMESRRVESRRVR